MSSWSWYTPSLGPIQLKAQNNPVQNKVVFPMNNQAHTRNRIRHVTMRNWISIHVGLDAWSGEARWTRIMDAWSGEPRWTKRRAHGFRKWYLPFDLFWPNSLPLLTWQIHPICFRESGPLETSPELQVLHFNCPDFVRTSSSYSFLSLCPGFKQALELSRDEIQPNQHPEFRFTLHLQTEGLVYLRNFL